MTRKFETKTWKELLQDNSHPFTRHAPQFFLTLANTLKAKVGDVVGCIFQIKCSVGGFLILKQIIVTFPGSANLTTSPQSTSITFLQYVLVSIVGAANHWSNQELFT
jgi:hypothetical protein